jgi:hemerythrin-like metal-binding protein
MSIFAEERSLAHELQQSIAEEHRLLAEQVELASLEIGNFFSKAAKRSPSDVKRLVRLLGELIETAEAHFHHEEALMKKDGFSGFFLHKRDHDDLLRRLNRFASLLSCGGVLVSAGISMDLQSWLTGHMQKFDEPYVAFTESRTRDAGG